MKSKHIMIFEPSVHDEMRVYEIRIGISRREQAQADKLIVAAAKNHDIFFKRYSCEVCKFLQRLAEQVYDYLGPSSAWEKFHLRNVRQISLSEAVSLVTSANPCHVINQKQ